MAHIKHRLIEPGSTLEPRSAERLRKSVLALKLASHPIRLRIIFRLVEGEREANQLGKDLGFTVRELGCYLDPLRRGGLVRSAGTTRHNSYDLTEVGFKTVRYIAQTFGPIHWNEPLPESARTNRVGRKQKKRPRQKEIERRRAHHDKALDPAARIGCDGTL